MKHQSGIWTFPGGAKDPADQTLEDCLIRELKEEIGLDIARDKLVNTYLVNKFTYGSEKPSRNGKRGETHFWLLQLSGEKVLGSWDKIIDHGWFSSEKIIEMLPFADERKTFLEAIKKFLGLYLGTG